MRMLLVRHAQSTNNAQPTELRVPDPDLTEQGYRQAKLLADWVETLPLTSLWCSPFLRSLQTTEAIRKRLHIQPEIFLDLHEVGGCFSGYEAVGKKGEPGMGADELRSRFPQYRLDPQIGAEGWWNRRPFETEEVGRLRAQKVTGWMAQHLCAAREHLVVAVIHADFKRLLLESMLGTKVDIVTLGPILNTSVTSLRWDGVTWKIDYYNSISHLPFPYLSE